MEWPPDLNRSRSFAIRAAARRRASVEVGTLVKTSWLYSCKQGLSVNGESGEMDSGCIKLMSGSEL